MIELEERLHDAIGVLAEAEPVTVPPLGFVIEQGGRSVRPRRPRAAIAVAAVGGLALVGTAVGAAGLLPDSITRTFHRISGWGEPCRVDVSSARLVASTRVTNGRTLQWWRATGARAVGDAFRMVDSDGSSRALSESCLVDAPSPTKLYGSFGPSGHDPVAPDDVFWGLAPQGTVRVQAVYRDGSAVAIPLQNGRFFMGPLTRLLDRPSDFAGIEALSADGSVIDRVSPPKT